MDLELLSDRRGRQHQRCHGAFPAYAVRMRL